jgi:release factor glutamine methyltransferase
LDIDYKFSVIVSNPPYIPNKDLPGLPREVREFEPHVALFGGDIGTEIVRRLLDDAPNFLEKNGFFLFEIGFTQGEAVQGMIDENVWQLVKIKDDLAGIPRIVVLRLNS